ncbi:hypothetical protein F5878DRAFT_709425 [Lentinula raphanica]|uniref:Uncharacterized protein n=1 Tax=Lentinula raphanica TaxID=153919 RepID=A0AA38UFQ1_9AGAR|nr:hypothetical protein F5880DRAFT_776473 [Lentinula raphanica]KAJ3839506.1 hypothetical protein F5878DRAFT_709425 [Lentinula raphanica]
MSPDEQELLSSSAEVLFFNIVNSIVTITGYGAFVLGTTIAISSLLRRYPLRHSLSGRGLLVCLIVIFIFFTWHICYFGGLALTDFHYAFARILPGGLVAQIQSANNHTTAWRYVAEAWIPTIIALLDDCIIVWRAWILFQQDKFVRLSLMALMMANIGVNVADCIWSDIELQLEMTRFTTLDWLSFALTLAVNLYATILIALKAWHHHRFMKDALLYKKTRAQHILLLLVESGAIYCTIQTVYEVLLLLEIYTTVDTSFIRNTSITMSVYVLVAACYPVAVMILAYNDISPVAQIETFNFQVMLNSHSDAQTAVRRGRDRTGAAAI